jgi:hypothetical protein
MPVSKLCEQLLRWLGQCCHLRKRVCIECGAMAHGCALSAHALDEFRACRLAIASRLLPPVGGSRVGRSDAPKRDGHQRLERHPDEGSEPLSLPRWPFHNFHA